MKLTREQLHHIAELARLKLTPEEEERLSKDTSQILEYVEMISVLNLAESPTKAALNPEEWRPDCVEASLSVDDALSNAPCTEDHQIIVPPVLPGQEDGA